MYHLILLYSMILYVIIRGMCARGTMKLASTRPSLSRWHLVIVIAGAWCWVERHGCNLNAAAAAKGVQKLGHRRLFERWLSKNCTGLRKRALTRAHVSSCFCMSEYPLGRVCIRHAHAKAILLFYYYKYIFAVLVYYYTTILLLYCYYITTMLLLHCYYMTMELLLLLLYYHYIAITLLLYDYCITTIKSLVAFEAWTSKRSSGGKSKVRAPSGSFHK